MKKVLFFVALAAISISAFAVTEPSKNLARKKPLKATEVFLPVGDKQELLSVYELSFISPKELQKLTGKKMSWGEKMSFKMTQKKLRKSINADGSFNNKKANKYFNRLADGGGAHIGGLALGFLLGLIGVLIAYLINDDKKSARTKWAWIGFGAAVVLYILLLI